MVDMSCDVGLALDVNHVAVNNEQKSGITITDEMVIFFLFSFLFFSSSIQRGNVHGTNMICSSIHEHTCTYAQNRTSTTTNSATWFLSYIDSKVKSIFLSLEGRV